MPILTNNPKVNAYIDNLLTNDPMHKWMSSNTGEIKKAIKSGEFQKIYSEMFAK